MRKHSPDPQIVGANAFIEEAQAFGNLEQGLAKQPAQPRLAGSARISTISRRKCAIPRGATIPC
jgi:hypothetical protein